MAEIEKSEARGPVVRAEDLRNKALELQLLEMKHDEEIRTREAAKHAEFINDFFRKHMGDKERDLIRRVVMQAAADGKLEAMAHSFPSSPCTDIGHAINSSGANWPATLQGKAEELYDLFVEVAQPRGCGPKAKVINFPDGMPAT